MDVKLEPERVNYQKSVELFEVYDKILLSGGAAVVETALKYLFDKLVELQNQRMEIPLSNMSF